jgi:predicted MFS family arabinose efflux permease
MQLLPRAVARGRAHARRFPRPFWLLVGAGAVRSLGSGLFVPYWALYLTGSLGASGAQAGALLAAAGGVGIVGAPLGGLLADRLGRRPTLMLSLAGSGAALIAYGTLDSLLAIAIFTPFFGITSDLEGPATSAAIADLVEPELRTEAYGLKRQANNMAFALGPPLGALLTLGLSLGWLFVFAGVTTLAYFVTVWRGLPETRPPVGEGEPPARLREAARDRRLLALALGTGVGIVVYSQFDSVLGVFLHDERGYALATWGAIFGINPVMVGLLQYPVARWAGSRSPRAILALGTVLQGLALFALWPASSLPFLAGAILVLTIGEMLLSPVASALAAALAPARLRGSYEGVVDTAFAVSWAPGVLVGLWLVGAGRGELMLIAALPLAVLGAFCFLPLPREPVDPEAVLPVPAEAAAL